MPKKNKAVPDFNFPSNFVEDPSLVNTSSPQDDLIRQALESAKGMSETIYPQKTYTKTAKELPQEYQPTKKEKTRAIISAVLRTFAPVAAYRGAPGESLNIPTIDPFEGLKAKQAARQAEIEKVKAYNEGLLSEEEKQAQDVEERRGKFIQAVAPTILSNTLRAEREPKLTPGEQMEDRVRVIMASDLTDEEKSAAIARTYGVPSKQYSPYERAAGGLQAREDFGVSRDPMEEWIKSRFAQWLQSKFTDPMNVDKTPPSQPEMDSALTSIRQAAASLAGGDFEGQAPRPPSPLIPSHQVVPPGTPAQPQAPIALTRQASPPPEQLMPGPQVQTPPAPMPSPTQLPPQVSPEVVNAAKASYLRIKSGQVPNAQSLQGPDLIGKALIGFESYMQNNQGNRMAIEEARRDFISQYNIDPYAILFESGPRPIQPAQTSITPRAGGL